MIKSITSLFAVLFGSLLIAVPANAVERHVDCDKGQSIQKELETAPAAAGERFEIYVTGTCEERVLIRKDDVTIDGDATIIGDVRVFNASDVWLFGLTITGPGNGVSIAGSNSVRLTGVALVGNSGHGLSVSSRGLAWLRFGTTISENVRTGVYVENSSVRIDNARIVNNFGNGVEAMIGTVITNRDATISGNYGHGIDANFHSSVLMRESSRIGDNRASGVRLDHDSGLLTFDGAIISDNLEFDVSCGDTESSSQFFATVPDNVECTGFDQ